MAAQRKKLAIIDGKSVFYRGYYAMPNLSTKDGTPTGGVYGFAAMALELIKRLKPDYVCVAWDKPKTNIRRRVQLYPEYKAGRKPAPPDFYAQIPLLHELLDTFGWPLYELDDYEADDIMGTLAVQAAKQDIESMLITSDLDMLQLIDPHIYVYALKKGLTNIELFQSAYFEEKYGIKPTQFLDLKALKGDSSDNIPGVPGIGEKTAITLLKEFQTLDGVFENVELTKGSVSAKLKAGKELAYLSKELAAIWTDAPLKLDLASMDGSAIDTKKVADILQRLEFRSLVRQLPNNMQSETPQTDMIGGISLTLPKNIMVGSVDALKKCKLDATKPLFVHSRSAGKHGNDPQILLIGNDETVYSIDIRSIGSVKVAQALSSVLSAQSSVVGYDVKSTLKMLDALGYTPLPGVNHDVLVGAFLINSLERSQSLSDLATMQLGFEGSSLEDLPPEDVLQRAPEIMAVIRELYVRQHTALQKIPSVKRLAVELEWPVIPVIAAMERRGIKLNAHYLEDFSKELTVMVSDFEQQIYKHAGVELNINSPSQLADVLFTKLLLPVQGIKKGKTGYSTAASELDKLRGIHPIIELITHYREVTKLKSTYVDALPRLADQNQRVHTTFNLTIAQTGRLSSTDPNLQNIPVRTDLGKRIRTAFIAEEDSAFVSADYSQFELRIAAVLAEDKEMIELFNQDADIHIMTAAAVHGIAPEAVTKAQRYAAKAVNFGILYGQSAHGLAAGTGMGFGEARDFINRYFEVRPKLKQYIERTRKQALEQGFVQTLLGRRRPTPDVKSSNFVVREAAYRAAINMPVQGTAADLTKLAMIKVQERIKSNKEWKVGDGEPMMLLQIHDSILVECKQTHAEAVSTLLKETMEQVYELPVKLKVDVASGKSWGEI